MFQLEILKLDLDCMEFDQNPVDYTKYPKLSYHSS